MDYLVFGKTENYSYRAVFWMFIGVSLLLGLVLSVSSIDHWLENRMYLGSAVWLLEKSFHPVFYFIFYSLPKALLIFLGLLLLIKLIHNLRKDRKVRAKQYGLAILSVAILPSTISYLKNISMVPCPYNLLEYGGTEEAHSVIYFLLHRSADAGGCFPAGHASGGFALLGLVFLARNHREALAVVKMSTVVGFCMGFYQQARGAHFVSHTLATQALSLGFVLVLFKLFYKQKISKPV